MNFGDYINFGHNKKTLSLDPPSTLEELITLEEWKPVPGNLGVNEQVFYLGGERVRLVAGFATYLWHDMQKYSGTRLEVLGYILQWREMNRARLDNASKEKKKN